MLTLIGCGSKRSSSNLGRSNIYKKNPHMRPFHAALDILKQNPKTVTNLKTAIRNFGEALLIKPNFHQAYVNLGISYEKLRKYSRAMSSYKSAFSLKPDDIEAIKGISRIYLKRNRPKVGLKFLEKQLKENPTDPELLNLKVLLLTASKNYSTAFLTIKSIIEKDKNNITAISNLGILYYKVKKYNLAELTLQNGIKTDEKSAEMHNNLGLVFMKTGQIQSSIYEFTKAKQLDPNMVEPRMNLADLYLRYSNYDGAIREYALLLQRDPVNPTARNNYSVCLMAQNNYETAARFLKSVLSIQPKNSYAIYNLGAVYKDNLKNPSLALKYFRKYVALKRVPQKSKKPVYSYIKILEKKITPKPSKRGPKGKVKTKSTGTKGNTSY